MEDRKGIEDLVVKINRKQKKGVHKESKRAVWNVEGNINKVWKRIATCVKNLAKKVVGETKNSMPEKTRKNKFIDWLRLEKSNPRTFKIFGT